MGLKPASESVFLAYPRTVDGAELSELVIRRPRARDQLTLAEQAEDPQAEAKLLADLCEQTLDTILDLDFEDYWRLKEKYISFLPKELQSLMQTLES